MLCQYDEQKKIKNIMILGIYETVYSELKGKESVEFSINECIEEGAHFIPTKNIIKFFNIEISKLAEEDKEVCREEIRNFLNTEGIICHNINRKFPIL